MKPRYVRAITLFFALLLLLGILSGCGSPPNTPQESMVTFTDALGQTVSLQKKPERVAALLGSFADIWVLSGGSVCAAAELLLFPEEELLFFS